MLYDQAKIVSTCIGGAQRAEAMKLQAASSTGMKGAEKGGMEEEREGGRDGMERRGGDLCATVQNRNWAINAYSPPFF